MPISDARFHDRLACQAAAAARLCTATSSYCEPFHAHVLWPVGHLTSGKPILGIKLCGTAFQQLRISWMPTQACRQTKQSSSQQGCADFADSPSRCCQTNETMTEVDGLVSSRLYLQRQLRARRNRRQRASYRRPEAWWSGLGPSSRCLTGAPVYQHAIHQTLSAHTTAHHTSAESSSATAPNAT